MLATAATILAGDPAAAADASAWDGGPQASVRLIAAGPLQHAKMPFLRAGVEVKLQPGWKTYWRYPGDSGVPPRFDFSGSRNVKDVRVLWPAPKRFPDGGGHSVGYAADVIFPLQVVPRDPQAPTTLHLKLNYAVCEKLCVPVDAELTLALGAGASAHAAAVGSSEARVPKPAALGADAPLAIAAVSRDDATPLRLVVDVKAPPGAAVDLFAEGPSADWSLPLPEAVPGTDGVRRFAFDLDGLPPGATAQGARLTLTAVTADAAIEVPVHLD